LTREEKELRKRKKKKIAIGRLYTESKKTIAFQIQREDHGALDGHQELQITDDARSLLGGEFVTFQVRIDHSLGLVHQGPGFKNHFSEQEGDSFT